MHCTSLSNPLFTPVASDVTSNSTVPCYLFAMRQLTFVKPLTYFSVLSCLFTLGFDSTPSFAQDSIPAPAKETMPSDPKALMLLAVKTNGLTGPEIQPWHLKASYKILDEKGSTSDQGTYEEFWAGPTKYKRTFTGTAFTQSYYRSEKDFLRSGVQKLPSELISDVRRELVEPMPDERTTQYMSFVVRQSEAGATKLICLSLDGKTIYNAPSNLIGRAFCLDTEKPLLLISTSNAESAQYLHSDFQNFQGRSVAGNLKVFQDGKLGLTAHLEILEPLVTIQESDFAPPPDATPTPQKISISAGVAQGFLPKHDNPVYPKGATSVGAVIVRILIDTSGHVADPKFLAGPPELRQASLDCIRKWTYKPYLLNGRPIDVDTTVNLVFSR